VSEAAAIARLLADPDPGIATALRRQLAGRGEDPPGLREAIEELPDPVDRSRAREARLEVGRERAADRLIRRTTASDEPDLEECALEIARMEDPDLDGAATRRTLDDLGERARPRIAAATGPRERLEALSAFLGGEEGFGGDRELPEDGSWSSLPCVLETKRGLPIVLSVVYLLVARRTGVELFGVGAPSHFLVGGPGGEDLLYLDPFDRGRVLDFPAAAGLLVSLGVVFRPEHLAPTPVRPIVARMARNLARLYGRRPRGEARARRYVRVAMALEDAL
jgi:regulator of sirC expression with transglutaminase-like and TPR domain